MSSSQDHETTPTITHDMSVGVVIDQHQHHNNNYNNHNTETLMTHVEPLLNEDERQLELWLDVTSLHPNGPITCLICAECFINKTKIIMHYILNHGKAYCGTCRYLTYDANSWSIHWNRHLPLKCSQCVENFDAETVLRRHYINEHSVGHCRMCGLMMPIGTQYEDHLVKKHFIHNSSVDFSEDVWVIRDESNFFFCVLCGKENIISHDFFRHYIYFHKFNLKCFSFLVNGRELNFKVFGANISNVVPHSSEMLPDYPEIECNNIKKECQKYMNENSYLNESELLKALVPEIKQEIVSDSDLVDNEITFEENEESRNLDVADPGSDCILTEKSFLKKYCGKEDIDVTLIEVVPIKKMDVQYVLDNIKNMNESTVTAEILASDSVFDKCEMICPLCYPSTTFSTLVNLTDHMRQHSLKPIQLYTCRLCMLSHNTLPEIEKHYAIERDMFKDLYLCQLCDKDFISRDVARSHMSSHFDEIKSVTCTSPQLGLKCRFCPSLFWHEFDRERHHCLAHYESYKSEFYRCKSCEMIFSDRIWWASHELEEHWKKRQDLDYWLAFKCSMCLKVFRGIPEIRDHFWDIHPYARRLYCAIAGCISKPFKIGRYLRQHHELVHNENRPSKDNLQCKECGKVLLSHRAAATHRTLVHGNKSIERFKCRICNQGLPTIQDRNVHYIVVHPNETPFTCSVCGKGYNNKSALYSHRSQCHAINIITFTCKYCNKLFNKRDSYKEHLLIHIGPRHACPHCPRVFVQRSNMLRHARLHTGEKPYPCLYCDKTFSDKGACNSHIRTHTRQDAEACMYCGQEFLQKQKLKYHMRKHTGKDLETCVICQKKFTNPSNLREHLKIHDDSKSAKCPHCERIFLTTRYMERHVKDKHRFHEGIFGCPLCTRSFTRITALQNHLITHSSVKFLECLLCTKKYNNRKSMKTHLSSSHNLNSSDNSFKEYVNELNPRDCGLPLDDETLEEIFNAKKSHKPKKCLSLPPPTVKTEVDIKTELEAEIKQEYTLKSDIKEEYSLENNIKEEYSLENNIKSNVTISKVDSDDSDDNIPLSGLGSNSGKSRAKRKSSKVVNYVDNVEDDEPSKKKRRKALHKKNKIKCKKKRIKVKIEHDQIKTEQIECALNLSQIKTEPIDEE